jgi:serine/threonine protein kinase
MSVGSTLKYTHHTLVFYPSKNPVLRSASHVRDQDNELESSRYLRQRPGGFIFIRWLLNKFNEGEYDSNDTIVGLFASVDNPQELVVIKKLTALIQAGLAADIENPMAPEVEHCTLSTAHPFVQRQLPLYHENMELTPFPRTHSFQLHSRGENINNDETLGRYENTDITLFIKYYNGGTLYKLTMAHMREQKRVPESFIWQFLSQMGRALSWMHTGVIPSREYNLQHQGDIGVAGKDVNKSKVDPQWDPICHTDAHASNIWLHYPTGDEKKADPRLKQFNNSLPQIILGDFGHSFQVSNDDRIGYLSALVGPNEGDIPEYWTMPDKCTLANNLFRLLLCAVSLDFQSVYLGENTDFDISPWLRGIYSEDLVKCWDKLRPLVVVTKGGRGGAMDIQETG